MIPEHVAHGGASGAHSPPFFCRRMFRCLERFERAIVMGMDATAFYIQLK